MRRKLIASATTAAVAAVVASAFGASAPAQALPCASCGDGGGGGTGGGTKPKYLPDTTPRNVTYKLVSVRANDTEDIFGGDELYLAGGLRLGTAEQNVSMAPTEITPGQSLPIGATVSATGVKGDVHMGPVLTVKDQDFATDWHAYGPAITTVGAAIYSAAMLFPPTAPFALAAAPAVGAAYAVFNAVALSDTDDILADQISVDRKVGDFPVGTSTQSFKVANVSIPWYSDWDYDFTYQVTVSQ